MFICPRCRENVADPLESTSSCPGCEASHLLDGRFHLTVKLRERAACTTWLGREGAGRIVRVDELPLHRLDDAARHKLTERIEELRRQESPHHARLLTTVFDEDERFGPRCFAVFDQPGGQTLQQRLEEDILEEHDALRILVGVARALAWQHTRSVAQHGVLASRSRLRSRVRPKPPREKKRPATVGKRLSKRPQRKSRWRAWSDLLWRVFGVVGFGCPKCGHVMQLRTVVMPPATLRVLASLSRSARGPP